MTAPGRKVEIGGIPVTVVSEAEAEKAELVMCIRANGPVYFTDDVLVPCAWCGSQVRHRPTAPKAPPKVCMECVLERAAQERDH